MKISIYGPFPPNIGGVSTHIKNLSFNLNRDNFLNNVYISNKEKVGFNFPPYCIDLSSNSYGHKYIGRFVSLFRYLLKDHADIVHIHGSIFTDLLSAFYIIFILKRKVVFTVHDQMQLQRKWANWMLFKRFLIFVSRSNRIRFVAVNKLILDQLCRVGIDSKLVFLIPAYIHCDLDANDVLEEEIIAFSRNFDMLLSVYACDLDLCVNQKDIYGIDTALQALSHVVRNANVTVGMVVCVPGIISEQIGLSYRQLIDRLGLTSHVLIFNKPLKNPLCFWSKSDLYIRPTLTDGDSIAVREALNIGTVVIASDVVKRPKNCLTFRSEDALDLSDKIIYSINNLSHQRSRLSSFNNDYYSSLIDVYRDLFLCN